MTSVIVYLAYLIFSFLNFQFVQIFAISSQTLSSILKSVACFLVRLAAFS